MEVIEERYSTRQSNLFKWQHILKFNITSSVTQEIHKAELITITRLLGCNMSVKGPSNGK